MEKMSKNSIVVVVFICAFIIFFAPSEWVYPEEVLNTMKACDWCENNASEYYNHIDYYRNHFNLTQETFPCYCWNDAESAPNKIEWFFMEIGM